MTEPESKPLAGKPQVVVAPAWYNCVDYTRDTVGSLLAQVIEGSWVFKLCVHC